MTLIWTLMIGFPGLYSLPSMRRSVLMLTFGYVSFAISYTYTDSVGSSWCLFNVFNSIVFMFDYMLVECPGDEEESGPYEHNKSVKV